MRRERCAAFFFFMYALKNAWIQIKESLNPTRQHASEVWTELAGGSHDLTVRPVYYKALVEVGTSDNI